MSRSSLRSPVSGLDLVPDTPWSLAASGERWPWIDGIAYLRTGRDTLVADALSHLDRGEPAAALSLLLCDQDEWWDGPVPSPSDLNALVAAPGDHTLRDAMACLRFGRVGDYFAHRWSDPTFLAGLALLDTHWSDPAGIFELACGIGHYLREFNTRGVAASGADIVFSKLWLARHWVVGAGPDLVCFDARAPWPIADTTFDLVLCQDAFYFLEPKREILHRLRNLRASTGRLAIGHIHNSEAANPSAGAGVNAGELAALFPHAVIYDDAELTRAALRAAVPEPRPPADLGGVEAFAITEAGRDALAHRPRAADGPLCRPRSDAVLRRNPLYVGRPAGPAELVWPSPRYRLEYERDASYPLRTELPERPTSSDVSPLQIRRREVVDLPERW